MALGGASAMSQNPQRYKRRWRYYQTSTGACPVQKFLDQLSDEDEAAVHAAMKDVREEGNKIAHHIRNDIYEVRCSGKDRDYRILFSEEGKHNNILLALEGFPKKTNKVPDSEINLAEARLKDWRSRGQRSS
jgi:phage-related protein